MIFFHPHRIASIVLVGTALSSLTFLSSSSVAEENKKPAESKAPKVTYDQHVQPILREHCFSCHNQSTPKSDLALDSYAATMEGGASGEVVLPGELGDSRLWTLTSHEEEPKMPPEQDKISQAKLDVLRAWIEGGALENAGSVAKKPKASAVALKASDGSKRPEGPIAMPLGLLKQPVVYSRRAAAVDGLATSPWAPLAAVAGQRQISLYHTDSGKLLGVLPYVQGAPNILQFSRDGSVLIAGGGRGGQLGVVSIYDVKTGRRMATVGDELDAVLAAAINPEQSQIALGGPQKLVRVYSTADGSLLHEIKAHTDWVTAIDFSPDGKWLATADRAGGAFVWEAATGQESLRLTEHKQAITSISWRGDSAVLAAAGMDSTIRLWEMKNGKQIKNWNAHGGGAQSVHYTHDGRIATTGRDRMVKLWDGGGKHLSDVARCADMGLVVRFTHDGKRVIAGDWSGKVRMWDVASKQETHPLPANPPTLEMRVTATAARVNQLTAESREAQAAAVAARQAILPLQKQIATLEAASKSAEESLKLTKAELARTEKRVAREVAANAKQAPQNQEEAAKKKLAGEAEVASLRQKVEAARALLAKSKNMLDQLQKQFAANQKSTLEKEAAAKRLKGALTAALAEADSATSEKRIYDAAAARLAGAVDAASVGAQAAEAVQQQAEKLRQTADARTQQLQQRLSAVEEELKRLKTRKAEAQQKLNSLTAKATEAAQAAGRARAAVDLAASQKGDFEAANKIRQGVGAKQAAR